MLELVNEKVISLSDAVRLVTQGPAEILDLAAGSLCVGDIADACIVDPKKVWTVSSDTIVSSGKNTPLLGDDLRGKVSHTILEGRVVYEDTA